MGLKAVCNLEGGCCVNFLETDKESSSVFLCSSIDSVRPQNSGDSWIPVLSVAARKAELMRMRSFARWQGSSITALHKVGRYPHDAKA